MNLKRHPLVSLIFVIVRKHWLGALVALSLNVFPDTVIQAETVRITVAGHYEYTGANASPTADFVLSFTMDRHPIICGGGEGLSIVCNASAPTYDNGTLHAVLNVPYVGFRDAAHKGGLQLSQDNPNLNRLGFVIGASQLWTGTLADLTLVDGTYDICSAHEGQVHPEYMGELCSYAGQSFASGDSITNPFHDPVTYQSDDPILSGTITIAADTGISGPALNILPNGNQVTFQWLTTTNFNLEQTTNLVNGTWSAVTNTPTVNGNTNSVTLDIDATEKYFRLHKTN